MPAALRIVLIFIITRVMVLFGFVVGQFRGGIISNIYVAFHSKYLCRLIYPGLHRPCGADIWGPFS